VSRERRDPGWACFVTRLLDGRYREAERVALVACAFYATLPPEKAERLVGRLEIHHTPEHALWLNTAEIDPCTLGRQGLARGVGATTREALHRLAEAWERDHGRACDGID
jgi:hypothetical protein